MKKMFFVSLFVIFLLFNKTFYYIYQLKSQNYSTAIAYLHLKWQKTKSQAAYHGL
jgi:hypothetical protein